ncbi:MAG: hypothetical protein VYD54_05675 [Bdellovibrionota bacterium]|nr:hypothetical protein [Bdellovibrionota bacterium]
MKILTLLILSTFILSQTFGASKKSPEKKAARKVASLGPSKYTEQILNFRSTQDVSKFLDQFKSPADDTKGAVFKAISEPLLALKGIYWRANKIISRIKLLDNTIDSSLNRYYSNFDIRPAHIPHVANYFVSPSKGQFNKVSDFQNFSTSTLIPLIGKSIDSLNRIIEEKKSDENPVLFQLDLATVYGEKRVENLINKKSRYLDIYVSDLLLLKGFLHDIRGSLAYFASYNLNGIEKMISVFRGYLVLGQTKQLFSRIKGKRKSMTNHQSVQHGKMKMLKLLKRGYLYKKLFTLRKVSYGGKHALQWSREYFLKGVQSKIASIKMSNKNLEESQIKRSRRFEIQSFNNFFKLSLKHLKLKEELLKGPMVVHDRLFTENVKVNTTAIFNPSNPYVKDLKKLMPNDGNFQLRKHNFQQNKKIKVKTGLPSLDLGGLLPGVKNFGELKKKKFLLIQRAGVGFPLATFLTVFI